MHIDSHTMADQNQSASSLLGVDDILAAIPENLLCSKTQSLARCRYEKIASHDLRSVGLLQPISTASKLDDQVVIDIHGITAHIGDDR